MQKETIKLTDYIRDIPDFPKEGILFRDITPLLGNRDAFLAAIDAVAEPFVNADVDYVAAVEARGFIFGSALAERLGAGFIPIRKPGKLPGPKETITYDLEYGSNCLEVHTDAAAAGAKVLIVDDLLATGGTMCAACKLMEKLGVEIVGLSFLVELTDLPGRARLESYPIHTVIAF